ncbi:hypothetical protein SO802_020733 [Lithocarpus litseifolius]|uniref:Uncharacterized protein n=1 Tax=Lithocarpus litseifolius TaxID=425828 RepID=A0AAW2CF98_9ROSI
MATIVHRIAYMEIKLQPQDAGYLPILRFICLIFGIIAIELLFAIIFSPLWLFMVNLCPILILGTCAHFSCPRPHKPTPPVCQTFGLQRSQGHSSPTHYTVKSIHATTVGVEPISDGYDKGGYKQAPSTEAYLESFKSVGSRTLSELISKFKDSASPVNYVVYDSLLPWALDVARQFGIYGAVSFDKLSFCVLHVLAY